MSNINTKTILNIKTDKEVKERARRAAAELGLPLSTIVNSFLRQFARDKKVTFSANETPSKHLVSIIKTAREDLLSGSVVGPYTSVDSLMDSLRSK